MTANDKKVEVKVEVPLVDGCEGYQTPSVSNEGYKNPLTEGVVTNGQQAKPRTDNQSSSTFKPPLAPKIVTRK